MKTAADIVFGAAKATTPLAKPVVAVVTKPVDTATLIVEAGTCFIVGGIGAVLWKKHRWLGFFGGVGAADAAYQVTRSNYSNAIGRVAATGSGVYGSLRWKKHPALGFIAGSLAGSLVGGIVGALVAPKKG